MRFTKAKALAAAALASAPLVAVAVVGTTAAGASARAGIPTVTVRMNGDHLRVVGGTTLHAGRIQFKVVAVDRGHILQITRFHRGYSLKEAGPDFGKAFSGDTDAIRRIDENITFRGGMQARPNKPGWFVVTLREGHFIFFDINGDGLARVTVRGDLPQRERVPHTGTITAFSYGFESTPETLPAQGTFYFKNQADQPHFLDMHRVAEGTTRRQVQRYFDSDANGDPAWILSGGTSLGVISPYFGQMATYDLPPGQYVIMCFWPAIDTGMPHAFMGMFKFIHLV
jgi:hypothetical protein